MYIFHGIIIYVLYKSWQKFFCEYIYSHTYYTGIYMYISSFPKNPTKYIYHKACHLDLLSALFISHFVFSKLVVKRYVCRISRLLRNDQPIWLDNACQASFLTFIFEAVLHFSIWDHISLPHCICMIILFFSALNPALL